MARRLPGSRFGGPLPLGARFVGRGSRFGNPFKTIDHGGLFARAESLGWYRRWLRGDPEAVALAYACGWSKSWPHGAQLVALIRTNLAGRDVACSGCRLDQDCHADILLAVAAGKGAVDGAGTEPSRMT